MTTSELFMKLSPHRYHDMPVLVMAPSDGNPDFCTTVWAGVDVRVETMLLPRDVERLYDGVPFHGWTLGTMGLDEDKYYEDEQEAAGDILDFLWDSECGTDLDRDSGEWSRAYEPIAEMICDELPWREVLVIDAS